LAFGGWLLAVGGWRLAVGFWLPAPAHYTNSICLSGKLRFYALL